MPERCSLILFDIDGTLVRGAGPHHRDALLAGILSEMNLRTTTDGIDTAGTLDRDLITRMLQGAEVPFEVGAPALNRIVEACETEYLNNCASDLKDRVCPGVVELLETLTAHGTAIGVVTGNLQAIGWKKLELAGLRKYFQAGAFSQDGTTRAEVARKAVERALALAKIEAFNSITLIGDHRNDIIAATENGYRSIAVATGILSAEALWAEGPHLVVKDMTELSLNNIF